MIIHLNGPRGSGKSVIGNYFKEMGCDVVDTDNISAADLRKKIATNRGFLLIVGRSIFGVPMDADVKLCLINDDSITNRFFRDKPALGTFDDAIILLRKWRKESCEDEKLFVGYNPIAQNDAIILIAVMRDNYLRGVFRPTKRADKSLLINDGDTKK